MRLEEELDYYKMISGYTNIVGTGIIIIISGSEREVTLLRDIYGINVKIKEKNNLIINKYEKYI